VGKKVVDLLTWIEGSLVSPIKTNNILIFNSFAEVDMGSTVIPIKNLKENKNKKCLFFSHAHPH
jgi:hypothetical protein